MNVKKYVMSVLVTALLAVTFTSASAAGFPFTDGPCSASNYGNGACQLPVYCADFIADSCSNQSAEVVALCIEANVTWNNWRKSSFRSQLGPVVFKKLNLWLEMCAQ
jgi:hypothetical protein